MLGTQTSRVRSHLIGSIQSERQPETVNGFISQRNQPEHCVNTTITTYSVYDARNIYTITSQLRLKSLIVGIVATDAAEHAIWQRGPGAGCIQRLGASFKLFWSEHLTLMGYCLHVVFVYVGWTV